MIRSTAGKVMWVGRTASMVFGLALVMALVLGLAATAWSATGGNFILGKANTATTPTSLVSTLADAAKSALVVQNKSGGAALDLRVGNAATPANNVAPMKVNSSARVANLNAASAGRADSAANADNANTLDNKDSSTFAIRTVHAAALAHDCDTPQVWNECAPVTVTVRAGKSYIVSVWSSFSAQESANTGQQVSYCSAGEGPSIDPSNPCVTPFGVHNAVWVSDRLTAAASSGDTVSLLPGTYTFFTAIRPDGSGELEPRNEGRVITKVMVRDAANSLE